MQDSHIRYAPLFIHSFPLSAPRKTLEVAQFYQRYRGYEEIQNVPDRLRWCRYSKGLLQAEVAEIAEVTRAVYMDIECGVTQQIPLGMIEKLSDFYDVPLSDFLDEYNRFLYDGQANRILAYRESFGLGKKAFVRKMGIPVRSLQEWECGKKVISQKSWKRYFKERA